MANVVTVQYRPRVYVPITQERLELFLEQYAETGRKQESAEMLGMSVSSIKKLEQTDKDFAQAVAEARDAFIEHLEKAAYERAVNGTKRPIVGRMGKDEDGVVAHETVYSDKLLIEMLRRQSGDWRQSNTPAPQIIPISSGGGVLLLPVAAPKTVNEWESQFSDLAQGRTYMPQDMIDEENNGSFGDPT